MKSTRGVQHKDPLISDDFVVGCIMIMFLLLFCFGQSLPRAQHTCHGPCLILPLSPRRRQTIVSRTRTWCCCNSSPWRRLRVAALAAGLGAPNLFGVIKQRGG